jgi:N-glycosylase/DNA lyase
MKSQPFEMVDYSKINLENTINSGQVFLWKQNQSNWYGINGQDVLRISNSGIIKSFTKQKTDFFRKKDPLEEILKEISKDKVTKQAVKKYLGLRLLRQDPFQCFISFIVSSNSEQVWKIFAKTLEKRFLLITRNSICSLNQKFLQLHQFTKLKIVALAIVLNL